MPMANVHQNANDNVPSVRLDRVSVSAFLRASEAAKIERRPGETMGDALARSNADKLERVEALLLAGVKPTAAARWVGVPEWVAHRINRKLILALAAVVCLGGCEGTEPSKSFKVIDDDHVWRTHVAGEVSPISP